jgi:hypothetical protein
MCTCTRRYLLVGVFLAAIIGLLSFSATAAAAEPAAKRCVSDCECPPGQNCSPRTGTCELVLCPQIFLPVCGLDGKTYSNACTADANHIVIAHQGPCAEECGGIIGKPCPKGKFCQEPTGQCAADGTGICEPKPEICTFIFFPVCGCDGKTYSNDCLRRAAGVSKLWDGPCRETADQNKLNYTSPPKACSTNAQCSTDELCYKPVGQCDGGGRCRQRPDLCPEIFKPVCGCNGVTYSNECFARAAGVNVRHNGKCGTSGGEEGEADSDGDPDSDR